MDFVKLAYEILSVDDTMRYLEIIGDEGELIINKMKQGKYGVRAQRKEELLSLDLYSTKQTEQRFNKALGGLVFTHVSRTKVHQLVWYYNDLIVYCTCEGDVDNNKIIEIAHKVEFILGISKHVQLRNFVEIPH